MSSSSPKVNFWVLYRETTRGKSIWRILMNEAMKQWREEVTGLVLDCACGSNPSYRRILGLTHNEQVRLVGIDYDPALRPTIVADLTRSIPVKDGIADVVIVSGFLMLVPNPQELLKEVRRVLKSGGRLLLTAVLIAPYSPDPTDYMRFTAEGISLLLHNAGFTDFEIVPVGNRFSAAAFLLEPFLRPRWIVAPLVHLLCLLLDRVVTYFKLRPCPIGYVVLARK
jgi:SAM-dependent methyltransferase